MVDRQSLLDLQQFFPYQFSILAGQVSDFISQIYLQEYGLSKFEWRVLATIGQHVEISAKGICAFTQLDKMQASRAISKLTNRGVIAQNTSNVDRRTHLLALTALGTQMYQEIVPLVIAQQEQMLSGLDDAERQQLIDLTRKLSLQLSNTTTQ